MKEFGRILPAHVKLDFRIRLHEDCPHFMLNWGDILDKTNLKRAIRWCRKHNFTEEEIKLLPSILEMKNRDFLEWKLEQLENK